MAQVAYLISEMRDGPIGIALDHDAAVGFARARGLKQWPRNRGYGGERGFYDIEEVPLVDANAPKTASNEALRKHVLGQPMPAVERRKLVRHLDAATPLEE